MMILVAYRQFDIDGTPAVDRLYRRGSSHALHQTGGGEADRWQLMTAAQAREWVDSLGPDDDTLTVLGPVIGLSGE